MPPPYAAFPFPFSAFSQQAGLQQQANQGAGTKPPETSAESVGVIVAKPEVTEVVNV